MQCDDNDNTSRGIETPEVDNVVNVSMPASVYYNLENFQKIHAGILGRLGCPACSSGWDIRYRLQRDFVIDENLNIQAFSNIPAF